MVLDIIMPMLAAWAIGTTGTIACFTVGWLVVRWCEARNR
jgi:hypothetical protein